MAEARKRLDVPVRNAARSDEPNGLYRLRSDESSILCPSRGRRSRVSPPVA